MLLWEPTGPNIARDTPGPVGVPGPEMLKIFQSALLIYTSFCVIVDSSLKWGNHVDYVLYKGVS